jgi:7-cyano-7-deazaguanine synthase
MSAIALLSGGLDSTVAATYADRHGGLDLALTLDYGQRAAAKEIEAAASIAEVLTAEHHVVSLPFLEEMGANALTRTGVPLPEADQDSLLDAEAAARRAKQVWVPNRNALFIHVAACFAQAYDLETLVVGFNREEGETFPDNRPGFLDACNRTLSYTLDSPVRVESPTLNWDKPEIVRQGLILDAPLHKVWSCYDSGPMHCMRCESCQRLKRAFQQAGVWDRLSIHFMED